MSKYTGRIKHSGDHISDGRDQLDGDRLDIDYSPENYYPDTSPPEVTSEDHLSSHLAGLDNEIGECDQRWVDSSEQRQDIRDALDGYGLPQLGVRTEYSNYTVTSEDAIILCNGTFTVTLPSAIGLDGQSFKIKNVGTGVITVDGDNSEAIDGGSTAVMECQYEAIHIVSNGENWFIV